MASTIRRLAGFHLPRALLVWASHWVFAWRFVHRQAARLLNTGGSIVLMSHMGVAGASGASRTSVSKWLLGVARNIKIEPLFFSFQGQWRMSETGLRRAWYRHFCLATHQVWMVLTGFVRGS